MNTRVTENISPYHRIVLQGIPVILTNLDRDPGSPTYGCFDRDHWHYKVHDFADAVLQQSVLTLALVYRNGFTGNIYYQNENIRSYAIAGLEFCKKIQHRDGSFDQYWKWEHSLISTAFTLFAICETCDILEYHDDQLNACIRKSVEFLKDHIETGALNQEIVSISAIRYAAKILKDDSMSRQSAERFMKFLSGQNCEGWFSEYDGFDVSYSTVTLDYLIRYFELSGDENARCSAKKILQVLKYFIHPDGSLGGEYGSRNTEYFMPYGIEFLARESPDAAAMITRLMQYVNQPLGLNTNWDERYWLYYISHSFTKALLISCDYKETVSLPCDTLFSRHFTEARIFIRSTDRYYFVCSFLKGGLFKVFDRNNHRMITDCTYRLFDNKYLYILEWPRINDVKVNDQEFCIQSRFVRVRPRHPSGLNLALVRIGSAFLGPLMRLLVKKMIMFENKEMADMRFFRNICLSDEKISIHDHIDIGKRNMAGYSCPAFSVRYIPSSKFFQVNSLNNPVSFVPIHIQGTYDLDRDLTFGRN
jgi:hypothetical protein